MKNLANEPGSWDADFSYAYLARLYARLRETFTPTLLSAADIPGSGRVFVRHDVDLSLERAVALARLERDWGVVSTYHVMLSSPFYDVHAPASRVALAELQSLGHEVGLHYDVAARKMKTALPAEREADIARCCDELEGLLGRRVPSLSFHVPVESLIRGPYRIAGRVSGYADELLRWYLSDSRARWREGEPIQSLAAPRAEDLQILIHPIWWGPEHLHPSIRLAGFLDEIAPSLDRTYEELNEVLWEHVIYQAADRATGSSTPTG